MTKNIPSIDSQDWGSTLNDHLAQLMDPAKGGLNRWTNSTRPWANNDISKDEMDGYTGINEDTGKFEIWKADTRSWKIIADVQSPASYSGTGTVYGIYNPTDGNLYTKGIGTKFNSELSAGDYILIKGRVVRIIKIIDDSTAQSEAVLKDVAQPANQTFTFEVDSNVVIVQDSSTLTVGDVIYSPASYSYRITNIISSTAVLVHRESWFTGQRTDLVQKILTQAEADTFVIKKSTISVSDEQNTSVFSTSAFGSTVTKSISTNLSWKDEDLDYIGNNHISTLSIFDTAGSRYRMNYINGYVAVKTNESAGFIGLTQCINQRSYDPLNPNMYQGTVSILRGFAIEGGHANVGIKPTNDTAVTTNLTSLYVRTANWFGSINTAIGLGIHSHLGFNGTEKVTNYFPISETGGGNLGDDGSKVRNYFRSRTGFNTTTPSQQVHVVGNILATGTVTQSSDKRLKKDIQNIEGALEKLSKINGVTYNWKNPENHGDDTSRQLGVIAQEVKEVFPEAVKEDKEGIMSVNYGDMIAPLIEAVKELKVLVNAQQKEILELKGSTK